MKDNTKIDFSIFDTIPNQYLILSRELIILNASDRYLEAVQTTRAGIVGKFIFDAFPQNPDLPKDDGLYNVNASLQYVLKHKKPHKMAVQRYDVPLPDGTFIKKYWNPEHLPVLDKEGNILYIIQHAEDITNLMVTQEKLSNLEKQTNVDEAKINQDRVDAVEQQRIIYNLSEHAPNGLAIFKGSQFIIEYANQAICKIWGRVQDSIIGKPLFEVLPEIKGQGYEELLEGVLTTGIPYIGKELPGTLNRGGKLETVYFTFAYNPLFDKNGQVVGITVVAEEVTEHVKARQIIQEERSLLQNVVKELPAIVCIQKGPEHIYEYVNPAYEKTVGSRPLLGKSVREALPEVDGQGFLELLDQVYNTGIPYVGKEVPIMINRGPNGEPEQAWYNFVYQPMIDENQQISGIFTFGNEVTDQVKARAHIEKSNEELRRLNTEFEFVMDFMPQLVWSSRPDGLLDYCNKVTLEYLGRTFNEVIGNGWSEALHPDDYDRTLEVWTKSINTGKKYEIEFRVRKYDGTYRWFLARAVPLKDENGNIIKWYGTCTDIHEHKLVQEDLKLQAHVLESINEGVLLTEEDGTILYANPAEESMFGYEPGELIGKNKVIEYAYPPEEREKMVHALMEEVKLKKSWEGELRKVRKDGSTFFTRTTISMLKLEHKNLFVCVQKDITEEIKNKADLDYQSKLNKTITDNATSALFMMNDKGYCTFINPAGEKMLGFTFEEISQKPLHYVIHHHRPDGSFYPLEECPIDRALPENFDIRAHEDVFIRKDGTFFPVSCAASPIFSNGVPIATVIEVRDITEEKLWKQEIEDNNQELQDKNKELVRINDDLDNFIYTASHDLKAPVSNIEGLIYTLKESLQETINVEPEVGQLLSLVEISITRFQKTIKELTEISKTQRNIDEENSKFNIKAVVQEVISSVNNIITDSGATIHCDIDSSLELNYSIVNFKSIVNNLLTNAIKYRSPDRKPVVKIETGVKDDFLFIKVQDNGLGLKEMHREKIFEMFKRMHDHVEGSGVGLYIVKRMVENAGGRIEVETQEGKGSTFTIYLKHSYIEG
ncbi:MAG: PAS domain S-box protein [Cytophagaceae bacterium]